MSRRTTIVLILLAGGLLLAPLSSFAAPLHTKSHVVLHKSSPRGRGYVEVITSLSLHRNYRIQVSGHKHSKIQGDGYLNYTYVANKRLGDGTVRLSFSGSIPRKFNLTAPVRNGMSSWTLGAAIWTKDHQKLTVSLVDLGKSG